MNCIVTAGPTYESLDRVRRLTNVSTGRLGIELANFLTVAGHDVTLLAGKQSTYAGERHAQRIETFSSGAELREWLEALASQPVQAVFHAAAVGDFIFGKVWSRSPQGQLKEIKAGKFDTRLGTLLAELVPAPKIIASLRNWFPQARIVGWKFGVDGNRAGVLRAAEKQMSECLTDACVANGPAYGPGFGLIAERKTTHLSDHQELFQALKALISR